MILVPGDLIYYMRVIMCKVAYLFLFGHNLYSYYQTLDGHYHQMNQFKPSKACSTSPLVPHQVATILGMCTSITLKACEVLRAIL